MRTRYCIETKTEKRYIGPTLTQVGSRLSARLSWRWMKNPQALGSSSRSLPCIVYMRYDCTGQQVIDSGTVLINGERVSVDEQNAESDPNR
ncbi:MAG: hypothetical protein DMG68_00490 [Acidobacteria bacterium]|nr:MAG: hypothetical protein DMG68_00490 [Acidobacteriota bacterium]